jgi:hypothetical protein
MPMSKLSRLAAVSLALTLVSTHGAAQVTASTFGPTPGFTPDAGYFISNGAGELQASVANPFVAAFGGSLASIRVATQPIFGGATGPIRVGLYSGADMNTATLLEDFLGSSPSGTGTIVTFLSALHPQIVASQQYFVAMWTDDTNGAYYWNTTSDARRMSDVWFRRGPTDPWAPSSADGGTLTTANAFDVTVNGTTAPEPATLALLGSGLLVIGGIVRRRRA